MDALFVIKAVPLIPVKLRPRIRSTKWARQSRAGLAGWEGKLRSIVENSRSVVEKDGRLSASQQLRT